VNEISEKYPLLGMKNTLFGIILIIISHSAMSQTEISGKDIVGIWQTIDDEEGKTKSQVQVYKKGDKYVGKIVKLIDPQILKDAEKERFEDVMCDECPRDHGKDKPLLGLEMLWDMQKLADKYGEGQIMDPKNGKVYDCTIWLDDSDKSGNTLKVRGWILFLYRTQTWYRVE
jgi:uncharacterized protein (DUF2147 family)